MLFRSLGPSIDFETDGQPSATALGDDATAGGTDDEDGVVFLTPVVPGREAVVRVTTPSRGAFLNAWIDFLQDGDWSQPGDQVVIAYPLNPGANDIRFAVPTNAVTGTTFSRWRLSSMVQLGFKGSAINGEVEDHSVRIIPNNERCDLACDGTEFWLTFPGNYAPDPDNPPVVSLSIQGAPGTTVEVAQPGSGYLANLVIPASGTLVATLPPAAELGELNDEVRPLGVRVRASADVVVTGLNRAKYSTDSYRALHADVLGQIGRAHV